MFTDSMRIIPCPDINVVALNTPSCAKQSSVHRMLCKWKSFMVCLAHCHSQKCIHRDDHLETDTHSETGNMHPTDHHKIIHGQLVRLYHILMQHHLNSSMALFLHWQLWHFNWLLASISTVCTSAIHIPLNAPWRHCTAPVSDTKAPRYWPFGYLWWQSCATFRKPSKCVPV